MKKKYYIVVRIVFLDKKNGMCNESTLVNPYFSCEKQAGSLFENVFPPTLCYFHKNNAYNINWLKMLIFQKNLDLRRIACFQTAS